MLNRPTVFEEVHVDHKHFRVVKLNLDKDPPRSKSDKKKKKKAIEEPKDGGLINVSHEEDDATEDNIHMNEEEKADEKIYQDEIDCRIQLPSKYIAKNPVEDSDELPSVDTLQLERHKTVDDILDLDSRAEFTHFFALPLNVKEFQDQLKLLKTEIYKKFDNTFDEYFSDMAKLHLTLLMLRLETKEKVHHFQGLKNKIKEEINKVTNRKPINIEPSELAVFNRSKDGKSGTIVVRAKENRGLTLIRDLVNTLVKLLLEFKLIEIGDLSHVKYNSTTKKYELQEAHITLMKVPHKSKLKDTKYSVDGIVENFRKFGWGTVTSRSVVACTRGATGLDGFYDKILQFDIA